ncbi:MAG: hypothetical protein JWO18_1966 [Microbacteriaceae bacterium]|nr:hypothetical protein [Microbacteriaceae bacterium]
MNEIVDQQAGAEKLRELGERYFLTQHTFDPYNASLLGLDEFDGLPCDPSVEASEGAHEKFTGIAEELAGIDPENLDIAGRIDHSVLEMLNRGAQNDAKNSLWAANISAKSYVSRQALIFQAIPAMTVASPDGADRYLSRISGVGRTLTGIAARYSHEAQQGRISTAVGITHAIDQLEGYLAVSLAEDSLLNPARGYRDGSVEERARGIVEREIRPAMSDLLTLLRTELLPDARSDGQAGLTFSQGGEEAYRDSVQRFTTTNRSPAELHQFGLDILEDLKVEWGAAAELALGERDPKIVSQRMQNDPELRSRSREEVIDIAERALVRADQARNGYFPPYQIPGCVIEEIDPVDAAHSGSGSYRPPAADGSRPGAYRIVLASPPRQYKYELEALTFHESIPGHHMQLSVCQTLEIPRYRRHLDVELCGFIEGWGLYSEQLADEMGLYTSELQRLGMLTFSMMRACRLVIDTGIHYYGWSREKGQSFMRDNTVTPEANVRNEVDRYIAWPGQALAYMIGKQEILRLRTDAMESMGSRFSMTGFHGAVLENGAVPLATLAQHIERWKQTSVA